MAVFKVVGWPEDNTVGCWMALSPWRYQILPTLPELVRLQEISHWNNPFSPNRPQKPLFYYMMEGKSIQSVVIRKNFTRNQGFIQTFYTQVCSTVVWLLFSLIPDLNLAWVALWPRADVCQRPRHRPALRHHAGTSHPHCCVCLRALVKYASAHEPPQWPNVPNLRVRHKLFLRHGWFIQWIKQLLGGSLKIWTLPHPTPPSHPTLHEYSAVWLIGIRNEVLPDWVVLRFGKDYGFSFAAFHYTRW